MHLGGSACSSRTGCHSRTTRFRMKALKSLVFFSPLGFTFGIITHIVRNVNYKVRDDCNPAETLAGSLPVNCAQEPSCRVVVVNVFARRVRSVRDGGGIVPWRSCSVSGQASSFDHGVTDSSRRSRNWQTASTWYAASGMVVLWAITSVSRRSKTLRWPKVRERPLWYCQMVRCTAVVSRQEEAGHPLGCVVDSISGFMDERIVHTLGLIVQVAGADDKPVETRRNRTRSSGVGSR